MKVKFLGLLTVAMMAMLSFSFVSCSSDDDGPESGSGSLIGTWKLVKVVWNYENGKSGVDDYSNTEPDDGLDNYLFISETTLTYSEDINQSYAESTPYKAENGVLYREMDSYSFKYTLEGNQLVIIDEWTDPKGNNKYEAFYYNRIK